MVGGLENSMGTKSYVVRYWSDDGNWGSSYDRFTTFSFLANSDDEAREVASDYITLKGFSPKEYGIQNLIEIKFDKREIDIHPTQSKNRHNCTSLEEMIENYDFKRFEEMVENYDIKKFTDKIFK